jgi:hypothetical protein
VAAASLVVVLAVLYGRWRRRRRVASASREEDLAWDELLEVLRKRGAQRAGGGDVPDDDVPPEELLKELLAGLPSRSRLRPDHSALEQKFGVGGTERRGGARRWGNPTDVYLNSPFWPGAVHGLVINRSTGGLAVFVDKEALPGSKLRVRSAEAPLNVPTVELEVHHCRQVGKGFLIGCQFCGEVPWHARVWFG